jgi:hypothetical protein
MHRKSQSVYREFAGQNYLEVKYSDKDYDKIAVEEAWEIYNQNVGLIYWR